MVNCCLQQHREVERKEALSFLLFNRFLMCFFCLSRYSKNFQKCDDAAPGTWCGNQPAATGQQMTVEVAPKLCTALESLTQKMMLVGWLLGVIFHTFIYPMVRELRGCLEKPNWCHRLNFHLQKCITFNCWSWCLHSQELMWHRLL